MQTSRRNEPIPTAQRSEMGGAAHVSQGRVSPGARSSPTRGKAACRHLGFASSPGPTPKNWVRPQWSEISFGGHRFSALAVACPTCYVIRHLHAPAILAHAHTLLCCKQASISARRSTLVAPSPCMIPLLPSAGTSKFGRYLPIPMPTHDPQMKGNSRAGWKAIPELPNLFIQCGRDRRE